MSDPHWTWVQRSGSCYAPSGQRFSVGYSGNGVHKNRPESQAIKNHGPIPVGWFTMTDLVEGTHLGPAAIRLEPDATNEMFGRDNFFCHDDSISHPGDASDGCPIVIGAVNRRTMWASPVHRFQVVAEEADVSVPIITAGAHT